LNKESKRIVALAGGVGGAKLADGLAQLLGERLTVVVNTGDDFEHLGMHVSPDIDTIMYALAGILVRDCLLFANDLSGASAYTRTL
jgi:LPPG:FO 2-phospho-L-lactate transferase